MAAPTIRGVDAAPFSGYTFGTLIEHGLNERGQTADSSDTDFSLASAGMIAKQKLFLKDGLAYIYSVREMYWTMRLVSVAAQVDSSGTYSDVACPVDMGRLEAAFVAGQQLRVLTHEEYLANVIPTNQGGGSMLTSPSGSAMYAWLGVNATSAGFVLRVFPAQTSTFTVTFYYRASGQGLTDDADVVLLPIALHPILVLYSTYRWRVDDGDIRGAKELWGHIQERLEELAYLPPATGLSPVVHSTLPVETATRQQ